ncbi:TlpA family protein disulfide reductase [Rhabdothermincola sp. EGI L10124]|nr:TlpA disulfide reductase family protein [Rhabdothermincola salaria]MCD9622946.1 TlpA family protein disulfide reductase [Rhabdothermincola salaria]
MPVWQTLHDELSPFGLDIVAVALDDSPEAIRPWVQDAEPPVTTMTVVLDADHAVAETYGITNVPATVWLDEDGRVVKPPTITPGTNEFKDFTRIDAEEHHDALRRWVHDGVLPAMGGHEAPSGTARPPTPEEQAARVERRLASWLARHSFDAEAEGHYARAVELAPLDWTISRGSMPARGLDPFGQDFFELWQIWDDAGRPDYVGLTVDDRPGEGDAGA